MLGRINFAHIVMQLVLFRHRLQPYLSTIIDLIPVVLINLRQKVI